MKILSNAQIRDLDEFTISNTPISSIDLMENAALAIFEWLTKNYGYQRTYHILCEPGNNGGDGLALGRILSNAGIKTCIYLLTDFENFSTDNIQNQERIKQNNFQFIPISCKDELEICGEDIIVDAIFGSGLSREITGELAEFIHKINNLNNTKIAIDLPSGLFSEKQNFSNNIIRAQHTIAFQIPKLAFLMPQNFPFVGEWHCVEIGLNENYIQHLPSNLYMITEQMIQNIYQTRKKFEHKGNYGHAIVLAGSKGKIGAAVLATKAAMRSGCGLVTAYVPKCGYEIMQISVPESMCDVDENSDYITKIPDLQKFDAIGIGPGIGTNQCTISAIESMLGQNIENKKMVIDADGLNILAQNKILLSKLPKFSIITPHPKEFERLVGKWQNDYQKLEIQRKLSQQNQLIIVLKGAHTCITFPDGEVYINTTGNPGMATGGSGDVLSGIITGLLAQNYSPSNAAILGVYLHGLAGDFAAQELGQEAIIASDLITYLSKSFLAIST